MHAVIVNVTIHDVEPALEFLRNEIVPRVSQENGFVAGYWLRKDNSGMSVLIFESEEAAKAASERIQPPDEAPVTLEGTELREVAAHA
jgi:hypothetical protein